MSIGATATGNLHTRKPSGKPPVLRLCLRGMEPENHWPKPQLKHPPS